MRVARFFFLKIVPTNNGGTYQAGFDVAKKLVEESSFGAMIRTPDDIRTVVGTATAVNGDRVTLHTQSINPFEDVALADRIVTFTSNTKIFRLIPKDPKVIQSEIKSIQEGKGSSLMASVPFTSIPATLADITSGSMLMVTATENVKDKKTFTASEIQIQQNMIVPALPPIVPIK